MVISSHSELEQQKPKASHPLTVEIIGKDEPKKSINLEVGSKVSIAALKNEISIRTGIDPNK